ncbi:hypothetical protein JR316_0007521 [Psilocybe cubensis]|nr:hypothetical protein JR316_0007521 [Psilocybe cubensis]KAH9480919.1 hypothetical protein JR316_0007521 [Psilocybe cubensis]
MPDGSILSFRLSPPTTPNKGCSSLYNRSATFPGLSAGIPPPHFAYTGNSGGDILHKDSTTSVSETMSNMQLHERPLRHSVLPESEEPVSPIPDRMFAEIPGYHLRYSEREHGSPRSPGSPARKMSMAFPARSPSSSPKSPGFHNMGRIPSISKLRERARKTSTPYTRARSTMGSSSVSADDRDILPYDTFKVSNKDKMIECGWQGCKSQIRNNQDALQTHLGRHHMNSNGGKCQWDNCTDDTKFFIAENLAKHTAAKHVATYLRTCPLCGTSLTPQAVAAHMKAEHAEKVLYKS